MAKTYPFPSSTTWFNQQVAGETFHDRELRRAALSGTPNGDEYFFPVTLVCEPDNPHSKRGTAISVRNGDDILGYIPDSESGDLYPEVARVCASGYHPQVNARLWCSGDIFDNSTYLSITLAMLQPGENVPLNNPPTDGWALLPYGTPIQVTKEVDHFDVLQDYVPPSGTGRLLVTLHREQLGAKTKRIGVEIRLDGQRIGELTKASSEKMLPAVEHFENIGLTPVAYASIKGSSVAAEVTLQVKRSNEMTESELDPEVSPLPRLVPFSDTPSDYDIPAAFTRHQSPVSTSPTPAALQRSDPEPYEPLAKAMRFQYQKPSTNPTEVPSTGYPDSLQAASVQPARINTPALWLLWLFTGVLGGHRYYLGNIGVGIIQTLTGGGFGIWWLIDAFAMHSRKRAVENGTASRWKF